MYLINDTLSESLPVRFFLPSGSTRTSLHELSESELAELGIYYCDVVKPPKSWTQYYGYPVIEIANNRATATYPVLDYTQEDADRILEEAKEKKRNEIASARYEAECAGTEVNGMTIKTDRESGFNHGGGVAGHRGLRLRVPVEDLRWICPPFGGADQVHRAARPGACAVVLRPRG